MYWQWCAVPSQSKQRVSQAVNSPSSPGLSWRKERTSWPNSSRHRQAACEQAPQVDTLPLNKPSGQKPWDWNPGTTRSEGSGLASADSSTEARWPSGQAAGGGAASYHMVGKQRRLVWPESRAAAAVTWPEDRPCHLSCGPPASAPRCFRARAPSTADTGTRVKNRSRAARRQGTGRLTVAQINISTGPVLRGGHR